MNKIKLLIENLESSLVDRWLGVRTLGCEYYMEPTGAVFDDSRAFMAKCYSFVWQVMRPVSLSSDDIFYDIGCGTGRILFVVAQHSIRRCVGIELSRELYNIACINVGTLRRQKSPIDIIHGDAALTEYSGGTVFSIFDSFGPQTLIAVLSRIYEDIERQPRRVRIIYINPNPASRQIFNDFNWLSLKTERSVIGSPLRVCYYESKQ